MNGRPVDKAEQEKMRREIAEQKAREERQRQFDAEGPLRLSRAYLEHKKEADNAADRRSRRYAVYLDGMELDSLKELVEDIRMGGVGFLHMSNPSDIEPIEYALNVAEEVV